MMLTLTSSWGSLAISSSIASSEPATSALTTRPSSLTVPSWASLKTSSSETLRPERRASASVFRRLARSPASWRARRSFSTTRTCSPASGTPSKPSTSTGWPGVARFMLAAHEVVHRAHAAEVRARHERVADAQRAALDQDRHDRTAAGVELGLDHRAGGLGVGVGLELLEVGDDLDRVEQRVEPLVGLGADVHELGLPAPLRRLQAVLGHLGADALGLRALLVDLVDRDDDRHFGGLGVVDRLLGLRLDAVVGGDHDHRQVGDATRHGRASR